MLEWTLPSTGIFGTVIVDVDEHAHGHYPVACEAGRMLNIFGEQMKQGRAGNIHIIRFNPDAYSLSGQRAITLLKHRLARLQNVIDTEPVQQYSVTYLYYTQTDSPLPDVCLDPE